MKINASVSLGYRDMDSASVILLVKDFNKHPIYAGNNTENVILPGMFSLSSTIVQVKLEIYTMFNNLNILKISNLLTEV